MDVRARLCKLYGRLTVSARGATAAYVWDYANDMPVLREEMPVGSERWRASERVKWAEIREEIQQEEPHDAATP